METMKRIWVSPVNETQQFVPQEFIAACAQPTTWVATCDKFSSLIFYGDVNGPYDLKCDLNRGGCGLSHTFTLADGLKPEANCWILQGVSGQTPYSANNLAEYSYMFDNYRSGISATSLILKDEYKDKLIPAYVNDDVVDGVLLTSDIANIKNPS